MGTSFVASLVKWDKKLRSFVAFGSVRFSPISVPSSIVLQCVRGRHGNSFIWCGVATAVSVLS